MLGRKCKGERAISLLIHSGKLWSLWTAGSVKEWDSAKLYANHLQVVVKKYTVFRWAKEHTKSERN